MRWLRPALDAIPASVAQREPPPELRERLLAAVRADATEAGRPTGHRRERLRQFVLRPAGALALVAVLAAGLGGYMARGGGEGASTVAVEGLGAAATAEGSLVREGDEGMLRVSNMPPLVRDTVYEVWLQRGDSVEPSTLFVVRRDGTADVALPALAGADRVMVTRERRGGAEIPTGAELLTAEL
jgi:hypothetical protein